MLDPVARKNLELHLNSCNGCTEELLMLKEYISEVSSLRPVKATDDFLGKVNDRIKRRFEFEKITRALFIPAKIKLPLEAAGVVLTIVLVIITYRIIEPGINYYPAKKNMAVKKTKPISAEKNIGFIEPLSSKKTVAQLPEINEAPDGKKTMLTSIYSEQFVSNPPQEKQEMIDIRTLTKSDSPAKSAGHLAMAGAGKFYDLFVEIKESRLTLDNATYKVNRLVKSESGIVVFIQTAQDKLSRIITLNLPANNYASLLDKIKLVGKVQYQLLNFEADSKESLNLRMHLILSL